jgi:hypothetical protein
MFNSVKSEEFVKLLQNYNLSVKRDEYTNQFLNYYSDKQKYNDFIKNKINDYIENNLNSDDCIDVNGIVKNFEYLKNQKINNIFEKIGINEIVDLDKTKRNYNKRQLYNEYLYDAILNKNRKNQNNNKFINYFEDNILKSNIDTLVTLLTILDNAEKHYNKHNKFNDDISTLKILISELFDDEKYIAKLIELIQNEYINSENEYDIQEGITTRKDIKYLILNMKCNGYMFCISFLKNLYDKYSHKLDIVEITKDKKFVNYLIFIMRESMTKVSIIINKLLLLMKDYMNDVEDSYYNLLNYKKIDIKLSSDKYSKDDLKKIDRNLVHFNISKYITNENEKIYDCNVSNEIKIYSDILKSYYSSRYLDRIMKIDYLESSIKIKMKFGDIKYMFEMNLFQYTILKLIYENNEIKLCEIINKSNIDGEYIEKIINGFLKLELIKRTNKNIHETIFVINNDFYHEKQRLNITHKINKIHVKNENYLFLKDKIIYCNLIDTLKKKNKEYNSEELFEILSKNIPFKFTQDELFIEIKKGINIEDVVKIESTNSYKFALHNP